MQAEKTKNTQRLVLQVSKRVLYTIIAAIITFVLYIKSPLNLFGGIVHMFAYDVGAGASANASSLPFPQLVNFCFYTLANFHWVIVGTIPVMSILILVLARPKSLINTVLQTMAFSYSIIFAIAMLAIYIGEWNVNQAMYS